MMLRTLLTLCLLPILVIACAPVPTESAQQPAAESAAASDTAIDEADDHGDDDAGEHGDEEEHSHEDEHGDEGERREHGAHEHGVAEMTIAWSGNEMAIDLQTPAYNVLGFEYAPATDAEKALLEDSIAALQAGDLLQLDAEADCAVTSATVESTVAEEAHDDETHGEEAHIDDADDEDSHEQAGTDHAEEVHSDIDVKYNLVCQQPDNIGSLDASALFAHFPNFEEIQVQWVSDTQQSAAALSPENPVIAFN